MSTARTEDRVLVVRRSRRRQLPMLVGIAGFFPLCLLGDFTDSLAHQLVTVGIALVVFVGSIGIIDFERSGPQSTALLRIGPAGVEVPDIGAVAWADLDDVVVRPARWPPRYSVVAFIPRPGITPPSIPRSRLSTGAMRGSPEAITARYGSPLVLLPGVTTATAQDVLDAVRLHRQSMHHPV